MRNLKYIALWTTLQLVSFVLAIIGIPVILFCLSENAKVPWIWFNDENGYGPDPRFWGKFKWLALRNNVDNFKRMKYVAGVGRPLFYRNYKDKWYVKAGWLQDNGFMVGSFGSGRGY